MIQHQGTIIREFSSQQRFIGPTSILGTIRPYFHHKIKSLKMLKLQITHHQVYFHIATTTIPHTDKPLLFRIYSGLYFLGCAHKYPYQYMIQKGLIQLQCAMYPVSVYIRGAVNKFPD